MAQALINEAIANLPTPTPTPVTPATFDPGDASVAWWRDDFQYGTGTGNTVAGTSTLGELKWDSIIGAAGFTGSSNAFTRIQGSPYHPGMIQISSGTTANRSSSIFNPFASTIETGTFPLPGGSLQAGLPLVENPGWKMTYVFGFPANRLPTSIASPFPLTKTSFYCGLASCIGLNTWTPNTASNRPDYFIGLRYDTDPGLTFALTSTNPASGGENVYNGTITGGASNAYVGVTFTIAGMGPGNDGTFYCNGSSATTLTLVNGGGPGGAASGTAKSPSISDSTFKFEMVSNPNISTVRNNLQGTVIDTGITPAELVFYRLDIECTAADTIVLTLSNGTTQFSTTFSTIVQTVSQSSSGSGNLELDLYRDNGLGQFVQAAPFTTGKVPTSNISFTIGSLITLVAPDAPSFYEGTFRITGTTGNGTNYLWPLPGPVDMEIAGPVTITGYPGLTPYFSWGNDTQSSPGEKWVAIDFFSLVINPALAGATSNSIFPRFFYSS